MSLTLDDKSLEMLEEMGSNGFTVLEASEALMIPEKDFLKEFANKESMIYRHYRKGFLLQSLILRKRIFKDANNGSSPAQALAKKILDESEYKQNR